MPSLLAADNMWFEKNNPVKRREIREAVIVEQEVEKADSDGGDDDDDDGGGGGPGTDGALTDPSARGGSSGITNPLSSSMTRSAAGDADGRGIAFGDFARILSLNGFERAAAAPATLSASSSPRPGANDDRPPRDPSGAGTSAHALGSADEGAAQAGSGDASVSAAANGAGAPAGGAGDSEARAVGDDARGQLPPASAARPFMLPRPPPPAPSAKSQKRKQVLAALVARGRAEAAAEASSEAPAQPGDVTPGPVAEAYAGDLSLALSLQQPSGRGQQWQQANFAAGGSGRCNPSAFGSWRRAAGRPGSACYAEGSSSDESDGDSAQYTAVSRFVPGFLAGRVLGLRRRGKSQTIRETATARGSEMQTLHRAARGVHISRALASRRIGPGPVAEADDGAPPAPLRVGGGAPGAPRWGGAVAPAGGEFNSNPLFEVRNPTASCTSCMPGSKV